MKHPKELKRFRPQACVRILNSITVNAATNLLGLIFRSRIFFEVIKMSAVLLPLSSDDHHLALSPPTSLAISLLMYTMLCSASPVLPSKIVPSNYIGRPTLSPELQTFPKLGTTTVSGYLPPHVKAYGGYRLKFLHRPAACKKSAL